jgi:helicase
VRRKPVACLLFVSGRPMNEIEAVLTQFSGRSRDAAGPIRSVAARTCDLLPVAARIAEIMHPTLDLGDRVSRLAIRLTYGVPAPAVDLARFAGADLLRGDYCRLTAKALVGSEQIGSASDDQLLACLDKAIRKLEILRDAARRIAKHREQSTKPVIPVLEAYVA